MIRRIGMSLGVVGALFLFAGTAHADISSGGSAIGNNQGEGTRGGLFNYNVTRFGVPDPATGEVGAPQVGFEGDVSLAEGSTNLGPCEITGAIGQVGVNVSAGVGATGDATSGSSAPTRSVGGRSPGAGAGGAGAGGLVQCNASIEANLVSVSAECETAIGTISPSVAGPGASAGCSCSRSCSAELYWAKAGIEYTTPAVGGCGIQVSGTVGAEVMAGVAAGAERVGTVGGRVALGPVGVTAGINVEEFDLGKTADCIVDAAAAVGEALTDVGRAAAEVGEAVVNGIADTATDIAEGVGDFFGGIASGIGGLFGGGSDDNDSGSAGQGLNTGVNAQGGASLATGTLAYGGVGVQVGRNDPVNPNSVAAGAADVAGAARNVTPTNAGQGGSSATFLRP